MAEWDEYKTFEDFLSALETGRIDKSKLTIYLDCTDFYVLDEQENELISGDESDAFKFLLSHLNIKQGEI